jgi:hypothetical protein
MSSVISFSYSSTALLSSAFSDATYQRRQGISLYEAHGKAKYQFHSVSQRFCTLKYGNGQSDDCRGCANFQHSRRTSQQKGIRKASKCGKEQFKLDWEHAAKACVFTADNEDGGTKTRSWLPACTFQSHQGDSASQYVFVSLYHGDCRFQHVCQSHRG